MFKAIKEFLFGKPAEANPAPYKVEPPAVEKQPDPITVPVEPPAAEVVPLNPVRHEWPKAEPAKAEEPKPAKKRTKKEPSGEAKPKTTRKAKAKKSTGETQ